MRYVIRDITTVDYGLVCHGVNCQGKMGSGVAKAIRETWPQAYEVYKRAPIGKNMLGTCLLVTIERDKLFVGNCYTQIFYGIGGRFADPDAIKRSLQRAYGWADHFEVPLYMPKIGAGLGGLDWKREVEPIIIDLDSKWYKTETYICVIDDKEIE